MIGGARLGKFSVDVTPTAGKIFRDADDVLIGLGDHAIGRQNEITPDQHETFMIGNAIEGVIQSGASALSSGRVNDLVVDRRKRLQISLEHVTFVIAYDQKFRVGELLEQMKDHRQIVHRHQRLRFVARQYFHSTAAPSGLYYDVFQQIQPPSHFHTF